MSFSDYLYPTFNSAPPPPMGTRWLRLECVLRIPLRVVKGDLIEAVSQNNRKEVGPVSVLGRAFRNLHVDPLSLHTSIRNKQVEFNYLIQIVPKYPFILDKWIVTSNLIGRRVSCDESLISDNDSVRVGCSNDNAMTTIGELERIEWWTVCNS